MAHDLLSRIRSEIDERLSELRPLLAEHERLIDAAGALETAFATDSVDPPARTNGSISRQVRKRTSVSPVRVARPAADRKSARSAPRAPRAPRASRAPRAARSIERETIVDALEHGSHTVAELTVVTAMSAPNINRTLRKLLAEGAVVKTEREGKAAWALAAGA